MSIKVRALRGCCIGIGKYLRPGDVADVAPLAAAVLVAQAAATLLDERDAPALRDALLRDMREQHGGRLGKPPTDSPWTPIH